MELPQKIKNRSYKNKCCSNKYTYKNTYIKQATQTARTRMQNKLKESKRKILLRAEAEINKLGKCGTKYIKSCVEKYQQN